MKRVSKSLELWNLRWNKESMSKGQKCHSARIFKRWRKSSGDYIWQDLLAFNSILLFLPVCLLGARGLWKFTAARRTPETTSYWCSSWKAESFGLTKERLCLSVLYTPQNNISGLKFAKGTCWLALDALSIFAPFERPGLQNNCHLALAEHLFFALLEPHMVTGAASFQPLQWRQLGGAPLSLRCHRNSHPLPAEMLKNECPSKARDQIRVAWK